jgi:hypothetical protein
MSRCESRFQQSEHLQALETTELTFYQNLTPPALGRVQTGEI